MTRRRRKRLLAAAESAFHEGAAQKAHEQQPQHPDEPVPPEPGYRPRPSRPMYGMGLEALEVAWYEGYALDRPVSAMSQPLPTRVWALVLAEAQRP